MASIVMFLRALMSCRTSYAQRGADRGGFFVSGETLQKCCRRSSRVYYRNYVWGQRYE
ncbi:unnamed protein product [Brassica oleracea]